MASRTLRKGWAKPPKEGDPLGTIRTVDGSTPAETPLYDGGHILEVPGKKSKSKMDQPTQGTDRFGSFVQRRKSPLYDQDEED